MNIISRPYTPFASLLLLPLTVFVGTGRTTAAQPTNDSATYAARPDAIHRKLAQQASPADARSNSIFYCTTFSSSVLNSLPQTASRIQRIQIDQQEQDRRRIEAQERAYARERRQAEAKKRIEELEAREEANRKNLQELEERLEEKEKREKAAEAMREYERQNDAANSYLVEQERKAREEQEERERREKLAAAEEMRQVIRRRALQSPPPGNYACFQRYYSLDDEWIRNIPRGFFTLAEDDTYQWLNQGLNFQYEYDAQLKEIRFLNGPLAKAGLVAKYDSGDLDRTPSLNLIFNTPATLAHKAVPIRWKCIWKRR